MEDDIYERAMEADKAGHSAAAVILFERFLKDRPNHSFARFVYGENLLNLGRISDAERNLSTVNDMPPGKEWLLDLARGKIESERGNLLRAEGYFRAAANKKPGSTVPWTYLGKCLTNQERFEEAGVILLNALNASGDVDEVYLNLGINKRALGDYA